MRIVTCIRLWTALCLGVAAAPAAADEASPQPAPPSASGANDGAAHDGAAHDGAAQGTEVQTAAAQAEDTPPWAVGVPEAERGRANTLHARGLNAAKDLFYTEALDFYRRALEHWDHPKIRYNTAFVLIKLDQPIEARENMLRAVVYGDKPLGAETYQNALNYLDLLNKQLAEVVVRCSEPDVEVTLDGETVLDGAGSITRIMRPGNHQIVAKKPGMPALVHRVPLWAEQRHDIGVQPAMATSRRWAVWKPWLVTGIGGGLALGGALLHWKAQSDFDEYDRRISELCQPRCQESELPDDVRSLERRARWESYFGGGSLAIGSALALTGVTLVIFNLPRLDEERAFDVKVVPMATPDGASVSARVRF